MLSERFESLINEYPGHVTTILNLKKVVRNINSDNFLTSDMIHDLVRPESTYTFVNIMCSAVERGIIKRIIRVESPAVGGLADYDNFSQIPNEIFDFRQDKEIKITPDLLLTCYTANEHA